MRTNCQFKRLLVGWLALASLAWGYDLIRDPNGYIQPWGGHYVSIKNMLSTGPALSDGYSQNGSVQAAMQAWNANLNTADVQFTPTIAAPGAYGVGNGLNEIVMDSTMDGEAFGQGVLAVTIGNGSQADIIFNSAYTWDSYRGVLRRDGAGRLIPDMHRVAIHELGHLLGLNHPDQASPAQSVTAIMNSQISNLDALAVDDIAGGQALYGRAGIVPTNDNFSNAVAIVSVGTVTGTSVAANKQPGEPYHANNAGGRSVWWKWTAPASGDATVTTLGSNYDTTLAVYTGAAVSGLTSIAANDDVNSGIVRTSALSFAAAAGVTYYLAVDGWDGASGSVVLNVSQVVLVAPNIVAQPVNRTVIVGQSAQFSVTATGSPAPAYQWQRQQPAGAWSDLSAGGGYIGVNTNTLTVSGATLGMSGDLFRVVVSNGAGNVTSNAAVLTVEPPPVAPAITLQPVSQTVVEGNFAVFSVTASGTAPLNYRWQFMPSNSSDWANLANDGTYSGISSANLMVTSALELHGASYRCVISNVAGTVTSNAASLAVTPAVPPSFSLGQSQLELCVIAGINHLPVRVPIAVNSGVSVSSLSASSNAAWVSASVDAATAELVLVFSAQNLINATNTATVRIGRPQESPVILQIRAVVSAMNITSLVDDPYRSMTYAIHQNGLGLGAVLLYEPIQGNYVGSITVGNKPGDLALSPDGVEMLVINSASKSISVINLARTVVVESIPLSGYNDWGPADTTAHIQYGPADVIYYSDGGWAPTLRVFKRSTQSVLQTVTTISPSSGDLGFGDFVVSPDRKAMYCWGQYGWSAGFAGSNVARLDIAADGQLSFKQLGNLSYPSFARDPLNTPALLSADGEKVFIKQFAFDPESLLTPAQIFSSPVYAISPGGEIASTASSIYEVESGNKLYDLPASYPIQAITSDYARLVYFDTAARGIRSVNLIESVGSILLGRNTYPVDGAVVLPPTQLRWTPQPGIDRYRVYLGTSSSAVVAANPLAPEYLGEVTGSTIDLPAALAPGITYYWRVDSVSSAGVGAGVSFTFTVATIATDRSVLETATVRGHGAHYAELGLTSSSGGKAWTASASVPWISFSQESGVTPATLRIKLDASTLPVGLNQANVTISSGDGAFVVPVKLRVDPLALTMMRNDPHSTKVYAISEDGASGYNGNTRAYLLEIDTLFKRIDRVVRVGSGVTDLALHEADGRVYVTNWRVGSLLAINRTNFTLDRTYAFPPFAGIGYGNGDVYRVAAGKQGRLLFEPADQWINISLFNTVTGAPVVGGSAFVREGGGAYDPAGRFYFHGDNNISNAAIHRFDTAGDKLTEINQTRVNGVSSYGSRIVLISDDGRRVFWNGAVFTDTLTVEWDIGSRINSISSDGRYAFGDTTVYDVVARQSIAELPGSAVVSAFNSIAGRLVYQQDSSLAFYGLANATLPSRGRTPGDGAIVSPLNVLEWSAVPGATAYRIYLGTSADQVRAATILSPEYKGQVTAPRLDLAASLMAGQLYFWRIDVVVGSEVATGDILSFRVANVIPGLAAIDGITVKSNPDYAITMPIGSATPGLPWAVSSDAEWIKFDRTSGVTPATLRVSLDARDLPIGQNQGTITLSDGSHSVTIPVKFGVDPLALKVIKPDRASPLVYAISEDTTQGNSRAYLLELNSQTERVLRVVSVGSSSTDLTLHEVEGRIYVPNWKEGRLLALDSASLALLRSYPFQPYGQTGYASQDVYRVDAGGAGRLVVEEYDQWIDIAIYDTNSGTRLGVAAVREGGGQYGASKRYYYHGENNSSDAKLFKFDTAGDVFTQMAAKRVASYSYYGSRIVVISLDGNRLFWNGSMFDPDLNELWTMSDEVYCTSADGRYAFGQNKVYDTVSKQVIASMPVSTRVSGFNSIAGKLIVQNGSQVGYYTVLALPAVTAPPVITQQPQSVTSNGGAVLFEVRATGGMPVTYQWQRRAAGSGSWSNLSDYSPYVGGQSSVLRITLPTVTMNSDQFRCVVSNSSGTQTSNTATLNIVLPPVITTQPQSVATTVGSAVTFSVVATSSVSVTYQWQKGGVNIPGATGATYGIPSFQAGDAGDYRVVVTNDAGSVSSSVARLEVAVAPVIVTQPAGQTVIRGATASFGVVVTSNAVASYQWQKNGATIPGATSATLSLSNVQGNDQAGYSVVVTNVAGSVTSEEAVLTVQLPPSFTVQPTSVSVLPTTNVSFAVTATSTTPMSYQWQRQAVGGSWSNVMTGSGIAGVAMPQLTLNNVQVGNNGEQYRCQVRNVAGMTTSNPATLTVAVAGFTKLAAGRYHSVRVNTVSQVYGTGRNTQGQLGLGHESDVTTAQLIALTGQTVADVASGAVHTLFLTSAKEVWATGLNATGQLGDGTTVAKSAPVKLTTNAIGIAAGNFHSVVLKADGTLWTVGGNDSGQLGNGTTTDTTTLAQVATGVVHAVAGIRQTLFLKSDGTLWAVGNLDGSDNFLSTPAQIATNVKTMAAGGYHSLFVKTDGTLWAMGYNPYGQLGTGDTTTRTAPVQVATGVESVTTGYFFSLYLKTDRSLWAMGYNSFGQLGDGSTTTRPTAFQMAANVAAVSASESYTVYTKADGSLWATGLNGNGQFGNGGTATVSSPIQLGAGVVLAPEAPAGLTATVATSPERVQLTWQPQGAAATFEVWRNTTNDAASATRVAAGQRWALYEDLTVTPGQGYYYWVKAVNSAGTSGVSAVATTVSTQSQTITFNALADVAYATAPFTLSATASSGLGVTFSVVSGPATMTGNSLALTGVGLVTIRAAQPGNASYDPAPNVERSFTVGKATATVTLGGLNATYDGTPKSATATTAPVGLSVSLSYDGNATAPSSVGSYAVTGVIADTLYQGTGTGTLTIAPAAQTITFGALTDRAYTASPLVLSATASSGLSVTFAVTAGPASVNGNSLTLTGTGLVTVRASQAGDASYTAATPVERSFTVTANFASWTLANFTAPERADVNVSGANAIYGQDGLPNLVKYALGLDPKVNATSGVPTVTTTATEWVYTFTKPVSVTDVSYAVEVSADLSSWTTSGVTLSLVSTAGGVEMWQATYPLNSAMNVFFRLRVSQ